MTGGFTRRLGIGLALVGAAGLTAAAPASSVHENTTPISIPAPGSPDDAGPASPYPSTITVANLLGTVTKVTVRIERISHTAPADIELVLVAPNGARSSLMDSRCALELTDESFRFDDAAAALLPGSACQSGTYKPYPGPLSAFNGASPNGIWQLFATDTGAGDRGTIAAWALNFVLAGVCDGVAATEVEADDGRAHRNFNNGTQGDDVLVGTDDPDTIRGLGGDDIICGAEGDDELRGGAGKDKILGEGGNDVLNGQSGRDRVRGGPGSDKLRGEGGPDRLRGGGGKDVCHGGGGKDSAGSCEKERAL